VAKFEQLPAGFAETSLRAESTRNPELRKAFDNRYQDQHSLHEAERTFKKVMQSPYRAAKSSPTKSRPRIV
jgi:hypothetical protein